MFITCFVLSHERHIVLQCMTGPLIPRYHTSPDTATWASPSAHTVPAHRDSGKWTQQLPRAGVVNAPA